MTEQNTTPEQRLWQRQYSNKREGKERLPYTEVEFGYCQPFADPDQIMAYNFQRFAGRVAPEANMHFFAGRAPETAFDDEATLTLEATYDTSLTDAEKGNFSHQTIQEGDQQLEICAGYASFLDAKEDLEEKFPDQIEQIERMADYIQTLELGRFPGRGVQQPTLTQLFKGAQLAHFNHPAIRERFGVEEMDQAAALEASFEIFQYAIETNQDPFGTINLEPTEEDTPEIQRQKQQIARYAEIAEFQRNYDREVVRDYRPEVVQLPSGVQVGFLDLREAQQILGEGGMGIGYRKSDERSGHKADVLILAGESVDAEGRKLTKVLIGINTRNPIVRQKNLNIRNIAPEWNNLEYIEGVGAENLRPDNEIGGHTGEEDVEVMTLLGSPAETGTGLHPREVQRMVEEYFRVPRYSEEQLLDIAEKVGQPAAWIEHVPAPYPNQQVRERAIVSCALSPNKLPHPDHVCTVCKRVVRESELTTTQNENGEVIEAAILTKRDKEGQSYADFERYVQESPREALYELARGHVDLADYEDKLELLLPLLEGVSQDAEAIDLIYNARRDTFNPPEEALLDWAQEDIENVRVAKYQVPEAVPHQIDIQLNQVLYEQLGSSADTALQERYVKALGAIISSETYQQSHQQEAGYDHVQYDLLHIALNRQRGGFGLQRRHQQAAPAFWDETVQQYAKKYLTSANSEGQRESLIRYIERLRHLGDREFVQEASSLLEITDEELQQVEISQRLRVLKKDRGLPEKHVTILLGRSVAGDRNIFDLVEAKVGEVDEAILGPFLRGSELEEAERRVLSSLNEVTQRAVEALGENERATIKITLQGPQSIPLLVGQQIERLKQKYSDQVQFEIYQWRAGEYVQMPDYEEIIK